MANLKPKAEARSARLSLESWVAIAALGFILLIVIATLPGLPW
jgi:hypothetical protein